MNDTEQLLHEPSKPEWQILRVLWQQGPLTAARVNNLLHPTYSSAYAHATLKHLQVMENKKFVLREHHTYQAAITEQLAKRELLSRFVDTVFSGDVSGLLQELKDHPSANAPALPLDSKNN